MKWAHHSRQRDNLYIMGGGKIDWLFGGTSDLRVSAGHRHATGITGLGNLVESFLKDHVGGISIDVSDAVAP